MSDDATGRSSDAHLPTVDDFPESGTNALATFSQRAWARVMDTNVVLLPLALVALVVSGAATNPDQSPEAVVWLPFAWVGAAAVYEVIAVSVWGTTLGKLALGTRVARFADGGTPTVSQAFLRCLLPLTAAVFVLALFGVGVLGAVLVYFSVLSNPLGRGWHDQAGGTVVIRTR